MPGPEDNLTRDFWRRLVAEYGNAYLVETLLPHLRRVLEAADVIRAEIVMSGSVRPEVMNQIFGRRWDPGGSRPRRFYALPDTSEVRSALATLEGAREFLVQRELARRRAKIAPASEGKHASALSLRPAFITAAKRMKAAHPEMGNRRIAELLRRDFPKATEKRVRLALKRAPTNA